MKIKSSDLPRRRYSDMDLGFYTRPGNVYLDDYLRLLECKAGRRAAFKTQVFALPSNPHVRSRAVHTGEVVAIAMEISSALGLDIFLTQAIALGHDIGHVPFGHLGEDVLKELSGKAFHHAVFSVVVAQQIERKGKGLNLTKAVLLGILHHARGKNGLVTNTDLPQECDVVMFADKIAYTFSDLSDMARYDRFNNKKLPGCVNALGKDQRERTHNVVQALLAESRANGRISFSKGEVFEMFEELRQWMYSNVYGKVNRPLQVESIKAVYEYFSAMPELANFDPTLLLALMTDTEVTDLAHKLMRSYQPSWPELRNLGFIEILPHIRGKNIDFTNPDLDW